MKINKKNTALFAGVSAMVLMLIAIWFLVFALINETTRACKTSAVTINQTNDALADAETGVDKPATDELKNIFLLEWNSLWLAKSDFQKNLSRMLVLIIIISILLLLFIVLFVYLLYCETLQKNKNEIHLETQCQLESQEETNKQLQQTNTALHISKEGLAVTLKSIGDAVITTDVRGQVTFLNPIAEMLTGWPLAEAKGKPIEEIFCIINEATRQSVIAPVMTTIEQGDIQGMVNHTILIARYGSECHIADSCAPIFNRGQKVIGAVLVFRDVTKQREIEKGLAKAHEELKDFAAELKIAAQVKSEFLANMSHELRTPLNSINGFSEVLCDEIFGPLNEKQKMYINNVLTSGKHLLLLINQILDMAKVESGKMALTPAILPMKKLLKELVTVVENMIQKKNLEVILEIDEVLPDIEADDLKIKEIVLISFQTQLNSPLKAAK